ncbi:MAG: ligase-associated DNA damage response DEXH box helicase [Sphingobium sp.]|uniref:ligase-associated DNA damage response DEXH box helicase n=1 Tax=Sphingobium sp. TaxID=1912891 RepID=UPI0029BE7CE5|nr:ligase-associated DNA damage response DEXH box helicase [Sphingobium sp.]MDX3910399.1 ligase-associated DNA damage response DEXH box helicase [Sphingobium sp.]
MVQLDSSGLPEQFERWFADRGWTPRRHQLDMIASARQNRHALLVAPTGGGKTLAGFLPSLIDLAHRPAERRVRGIHTLYISPLKALAVDVARNLETPVADIGLDITIASRSGDTSSARRDRQRTHPPDILLTTPEQLALFCAWDGARNWFASLRCIVLDEIHALAPSKRGDLLCLALQRLQSFAPAARRVGLSATIKDVDRLRDWLAPGADGATVDLILGDGGVPPQVDVLVPETEAPWTGHHARYALPDVYAAIQTARTALIFVNSRWQAEFAFEQLWKLNEASLPIALHHGSLSVEQRRKVEEAMVRGELRAVICTSTLDMGIDWGDVDLVIQLSAPKGASRLIQRIGRSNHRMDEPSKALLVPANRFEVLECFAAQGAVAEGELDHEPMRSGALDALAQHVMGVACSEPFDLVALYDEVTGAAPFRNLAWEDWEAVVDFVATGGYALRTYEQYRRIAPGPDGRWAATGPAVVKRHRMNSGAIVTDGTLSVRIAGQKTLGTGRKIGEADESYFEQLSVGDTFSFAGRVWQFNGIKGVDAMVTLASDPNPKRPSWGGTRLPISPSLARRVRQLIEKPDSAPLPPYIREWLEMQRERSAIPAPHELLIETFAHEDRHFLICYPFEGVLAHGALAVLLTRRLARLNIAPIGYTISDYAICISASRSLDHVDFDQLLKSDILDDDLENWLADTFMVKRSFRDCAEIAGLIDRRLPGLVKTGRQVTFSTDLIYDVLRRYQPDHLLLRCAYDDVAGTLIDRNRLMDMLARINSRIIHRALDRLSPFSVPAMIAINPEQVQGEQDEDEMLIEAAERIAMTAMLPASIPTKRAARPRSVSRGRLS